MQNQKFENTLEVGELRLKMGGLAIMIILNLKYQILM